MLNLLGTITNYEELLYGTGTPGRIYSKRIHTEGRVHFERAEEGYVINRIELLTEAEVPGIDEEAFKEKAEAAKQNCPVSKALAGVEIGLRAKLVQPVR